MVMRVGKVDANVVTYKGYYRVRVHGLSRDHLESSLMIRPWEKGRVQSLVVEITSRSGCLCTGKVPVT